VRAFVLLPLQAIAPDWRHPVSGRSIGELIAALPPDQEIRLL
jgi:2-amino-4-hydroxy-6-hydroxymethyldihydropteridine diphosphokinase